MATLYSLSKLSFLWGLDAPKKLSFLSNYSVSISFLLFPAKYKKYTSEPKLKFSKKCLVTPKIR